MRGHDWFRYSVLAALILTYTTILLGGNVAASNSGLACPNWPTCFANGSFFPTLTGGVVIEWSHRLSAFVLGMSVAIFTALALVYERSRPALLKISVVSAVLVLAQAFLGGLVVDSNLAVLVVIAHLGMATILFGLILTLAILANLSHVPPRWRAWIRRASEPDPPRLPRSPAERGTRPAPERGSTDLPRGS
ncbi:MAG: COX15/CtaA family protein [Thermoplasmata archaeon]|jgi:heme A synthase